MFDDLLQRAKFYSGQIKVRLTLFKERVKALNKKVKIAIGSLAVLFLVGLVTLMLQKKPLEVEKYAEKTIYFNSEKDLRAFNYIYPVAGEELVLKDIVVNLKGSTRYPLPLAKVSISLKVKSNRVMPELQEKEYLIQDVVQRVLESFTYDRLSTKQGKNVAKSYIKSSVNKAFKKKYVDHVYFRSFISQPD